MQETTNHAVRELLTDRRERLVSALDASNRRDLTELLERVDDALARLDAGTLGQCEACGEAMGEARLLGDPLATVCLECLSQEESRALERDLQTASTVQSALLPRRRLSIGGWETAYAYLPHGPVSGDQCDLFSPAAPGDDMFFLLGDVSGKGISASLMMTYLHALFRSQIELGLPLAEVLARANRLFAQSTPANVYASLVLGRLSPTGELEIANAGHCPPVIVGSAGMELVPPTGVPAGLFLDATFETRWLQLDQDDRLFLYSDGLTEAVNALGEEYGSGRVLSALSGARGQSADQTVRASLDDLTSFLAGGARRDDLTVMVIRRAAPSLVAAAVAGGPRRAAVSEPQPAR